MAARGARRPPQTHGVLRGRSAPHLLFNLVDDSHELHNLADDPAHAATLDRLRKLLEEERVLLNDGTAPYPFSHKQGEDFWTAYEAAKRQ